MAELKRVLFDAYGGFADKRVKRLENATTFCVDDRDPGVIGADKRPLSWFCEIYAEAPSDNELLVRLYNAPVSDRIDMWVEMHDVSRERGFEVTITRGTQELLAELAMLTRTIVAPGARYDVNFYKYSCPRVAASLEKLKAVLDTVWTPGSRSGPQPGPSFLPIE